MFTYQIDIYEKQNNVWGWHEITGWSRPFTDGTRLDETLDSGSLNLVAVERSKPIKPFTRLRIIVSENNEEKERIYRVVASTQRKRKTYSGSTTLYDWTINTVEITKLLERRLIDTLTVTKSFAKDYSDANVIANPTTTVVQDVAGSAPVTNTISGYRPYSTGNIINVQNPPNQKVYIPTGTTISADASFIVKHADTGTITYTWNIEPYIVVKQNGVIVPNNTITQVGNYTIEAYAEVLADHRLTDDETESMLIQWQVGAYSTAQPIQPTITSVCERLLSAGITRRKGVETQEFVLDPAFESEYTNVLSPEFSFTNSTLFEALLQVGGHIHAIPRLVPRSTSDDTHYYVTFDKLGGDVLAPELPPMIYGEQTIDVNDWVGQIDTPAQNLVNTEDSTSGSITELGDAYITVRTEEGQVEINGDNVLIRTSKPIYQIVKVECTYLDNGSLVNVGDITAYIFESAEYSTLSSYWGDMFPYSKAWALCYSQGGNTITGLTFRLTNYSEQTTAFSNYAIVNIINAKTGSTLSVVTGEFMRKLAFRVTYVPIAQARIKAHKPSLAEGGAVNNALTYNQGANIAETSYYGEKMRGAIARLGHDVETRTYDIFHYDQLPKIGQLLDGKYIAHIDYEWDITKVRITVALTKDFNMLSQFVGLNSNYRLYDISEKQAVERNVNYDELIVVGDAPAVDMSPYLMIKNVPSLIRAMLGDINTRGKIQVVRLTPYDKNEQEIPNRACILPVVAFPFGTSIGLNFSYFDNYGAGYQQSDKYDSEANKAVQRLVPYTDAFGEIEYLKVSFGYTAWEQTAADQDDNGKSMLYPELTTSDTSTIGVITGNNHIILQKDSREVINFTYQAHYVSTRPSIVLSSGLSKYSDLVSINAFTDSLGNNKGTALVWLKRPINGLNKTIVPRDDELFVANGGTISTANNSLLFEAGTCPMDDCKAWAVCKTQGGGSGYRVSAGTNAYSNTSMSTLLGTLVDTVIAEPVSGNANVCVAHDVDVLVSGVQHFMQEDTSTHLREFTMQLEHTPNVATITVQYIPIAIGDDDQYIAVPSESWSYDAETNSVTIDINGKSFKVNYDSSAVVENKATVYMATASATAVSVPASYELLFGENVELNQGDNAPTITFAGALMQACNQDEPSRLMFVKSGTIKYKKVLLSPTRVEQDGTYGIDAIARVESRVRMNKGTILNPDFELFAILDTGVYVRVADLVSAYDFE